MLNLDDQTRANLRYLRNTFALFLLRLILTVALTVTLIFLISHVR